MNRILSIWSNRVALQALMLAALFFSALPALAQTAAQNIEGRYLFIFDTSAAMKKRLPAVDTQIDALLLALDLNGQLKPDDNIGVWVFDKELRTGALPLQKWSPDGAAAIATNIKKFLAKQSFSNRTRFSVLEPYLDGVVENSERLTILIFCDGDGEFIGSPYDADINRIFQQSLAAQKKAKQPFILVLRSQFGKFIGGNVSLPPGKVNVPDFPPLPPPPQPEPPPAPPKIEAPAPAVESLIIVGTNVGTTLPPPAPPAPARSAVQPTAAVVAPETSASPVHTNEILPAQGGAVLKTNVTTVVTVKGSADATGDKLAVIGGLLLVLAGTLTVLVIGRARARNQGSLITRSMNKR